MTTWQLHLQADIDGDVLVLAFSGRLGSESSPRLTEVVGDAVRAGRQRILLDFEDVDYISSAGLIAVAAASGRVQASGGRLAVCALSEPVRFAFDLSGLLGELVVAPSRAGGLERLRDLDIDA